MMALTATATVDARHAIGRILGMYNPVVIALCPCKKNITLCVTKFKSLSETFRPLLRRKQNVAFALRKIVNEYLQNRHSTMHN